MKTGKDERKKPYRARLRFMGRKYIALRVIQQEMKRFATLQV